MLTLFHSIYSVTDGDEYGIYMFQAPNGKFYSIAGPNWLEWPSVGTLFAVAVPGTLTTYRTESAQ